jgi:hypothetical protein
MEPEFVSTTKRISEAIERIRQIRFASDDTYMLPVIEEPKAVVGLDPTAALR